MLLSPEIIKLQRDRLVLAQFRRKFHADMTCFQLQLKQIEARKWLRRYRADQLRKPKGQTDGGQFAEDPSAINSATPQSQSRRQRLLASIINICVGGSSSITTVAGIPNYMREYDCRDGTTIRRTGFSPLPGFIRDRR